MSQPIPQRLLRDLRRSPKKAGFLALLAGVAIWFWAPLVVSWFKTGESGGADAEHPTAPVATPIVISPVDAKVAAAKTAESASQTWQELVRWMDQDPRRKADDLPLERNPFAPSKPRPNKPAGDTATIAKPLPDNPEKLGLKLTGTLLGPARRLAMINGRTYAEGQTVKASPELSFVVQRIDERQVTLERHGKVLVLQAVKPPESEPNVSPRP